MSDSRPRGWPVWSLPVAARVVLFGVEALAAATVAALLVREAPTATVLLRGGVLLALSIGYAEATSRWERLRRYLTAGSTTPMPNPLTVWSFAALLVLPAGWAAAFVVTQHAHLMHQRRRDRSGLTYRAVFTAAAAVLGQVAAAGLLTGRAGDLPLPHGAAGAAAVLAAAVVYTVVDLTVLLAGVWLAADQPRLRTLLPAPDALGYEFASLALGMAVAQLLLDTPWTVAFMLVPVMYLHRSTAIKALHQLARTDGKTGLLNAAAWTQHAETILSRIARTCGSAAVALIDIDHFKAINDHAGHLAGDQVLRQIADALRAELRGHDSVGRFGGDEYALVLDGPSLTEAEQIADRLRHATTGIVIDDRPVTVSIGLAHSTHHGMQLSSLLAAADTALYTAKAAGRGRLHTAAPADH